MNLVTHDLDTPIGRLRVALNNESLCGISFPGRWGGLREFLVRRFGKVRFEKTTHRGEIVDRLEAYFDGELSAIERLPVDAGGSEFQRRVWAALERIPIGRTTSYTEIARRIGNPGGVRAVATANATNPVSIVIPCHRVIHADGTLSGYGGGVQRKRWLLQHEGAILC